MNQSDVKAEINQFLQSIPEFSQQYISGGTFNETDTANTDESAGHYDCYSRVHQNQEAEQWWIIC